MGWVGGNRTERPQHVYLDDGLDARCLPVILRMRVGIPVLPGECRLPLQQRRRVRLGHGDGEQHRHGDAQDGHEPVVPAPAEVAGRDEVADDGSEDGAAEDGADAGCHGHAALHGVPDVDKTAADDGQWCRAEDAAKEASDEYSLDVLRQSDGDAEQCE